MKSILYTHRLRLSVIDVEKKRTIIPCEINIIYTQKTQTHSNYMEKTRAIRAITIERRASTVPTLLIVITW